VDLTSFDALTFDCYGTLIDWETSIRLDLAAWAMAAEIEADEDAMLASFAAAQREHQAVRPFKPYPLVLRDAFIDTARQWGAQSSSEDAERFQRSVGRWRPFHDTVPALADLKLFYKLGVLSNVDRASFAETSAKLAVPFDCIVTADDTEAYKPDLAHFRRAIEALRRQGLDPTRILHVAQSRFHDIQPAQALGLKTVWVDRRHDRPGRGLAIDVPVEADMTVLSLAALVDRVRGSRGDR
jgi:2-haloacid dehalogenase/putative hydrolase of the HAD superfamily